MVPSVILYGSRRFSTHWFSSKRKLLSRSRRRGHVTTPSWWSFPTVWAWEVLFLQHCVWEVYPETTDSRSASGHCRLATKLPLKHSRCLMRLSCQVFTLGRCCCYLGMIHGSPGNGFSGNDIYDITHFPFAPEYFGSLGRLNIQQRAHQIPSHMYFYLLSIALFST